MQGFGGELRLSVTFSKEALSFSKFKDCDIVTLADHGVTSDIGKPMLPQVTSLTVIPPSATVTKVEVESFEREDIPGEYFIFPVQPMEPISFRLNLPFAEPDEEIYSSSNPYPEVLVECSHVGSKAGYRIAGFLVYPVQYIPAEKRLLFYSRIDFKVYYEEGKYPIKTKTEKQSKVFGKMVEKMVINPEDVKKWTPPIGFTTPDNYDYVIITIPEFSSTYQNLANWKTKKGVQAKVVTTDSIYSNYTGSDNAEKIRNFIIDANSTWGAFYFLLGGDADDESGILVPRRDTYIFHSDVGAYPDEDTIPTDLYFSDLDGDWDADGDGVYGELTDTVDMYSDVFVGRAAVSSDYYAGRFVNKVLIYEKNPDSRYFEKMLLPSEQLTPWHPGYWTNDTIANDDPADYYDAKLYDEFGNYDDLATIDSMEVGYGFCHYSGHGDIDRVMAGSGDPITSADIDNYLVAGGNRFGVHTGICCLCGAFDYDCYAEHLMNNESGGTVGACLNSRFGWGRTIPPPLGPSNELSIRFFRELFNEDFYRIGQTLAEAKDFFVPTASTNRYYRWCVYELNLFGDPEMPMWTDFGNCFCVEHPDTVFDNSEVVVTVKSEYPYPPCSNPVQDALVCFWKGEEIYETKYTNASGEAVCEVPLNVTSEPMYITVTKHNFLPYEGSTYVRDVIHVPLEYSTIQAAINAASSGDMVYVHSGGYSERISMKDGVDVVGESKDNTYIYGFTASGNYDAAVLFNGCSASISNFTIFNGESPTDGEIGVLVLNCNNPPYIYNNEISTNRYHYSNWYKGTGVVIQGTGGQYSCAHIFDNTIHGNRYGICCNKASYSNTWIYRNDMHADSFEIWCDNYSDPNIRPPNESEPYIGNYLYSGLKGNIYCKYHSEPNIGYYPDPDGNPNCGMNSFHGPFPPCFDVLAALDCDNIYAICNWWGENPPDARQIAHLGRGKTIYYYPYLTSDPWGKGDYTSVIQISTGEPSGEKSDSLPEEHNRRGRELFYQGKYEEAVREFAFVITNYPDSEVAQFSLDHLVCCYWAMGSEDEALPYLGEITVNYPDALLGCISLELVIPILLKQGDYDGAIVSCEMILERFPTTESSKYALFDMGWIYKFYLNDDEKAREIFLLFLQQYPNEFLLSNWAREIIDGGSRGGNQTADIIANISFSLQCYPNPFYHVTSIRYALPAFCYVTLNVYNIAGELVRTLVDRKKEAGFYQINWDGGDENGKKVAAGIYFCQMLSEDYNSTKKLILVR
ncbi:tetratricopeptide repeat protein [candidate division WOR-3 bacterium]|nr:tetratricopeptide repeat protein [candidate division WOR-3 bacterium]